MGRTFGYHPALTVSLPLPSLRHPGEFEPLTLTSLLPDTPTTRIMRETAGAVSSKGGEGAAAAPPLLVEPGSPLLLPQPAAAASSSSSRPMKQMEPQVSAFASDLSGLQPGAGAGALGSSVLPPWLRGRGTEGPPAAAVPAAATTATPPAFNPMSNDNAGAGQISIASVTDALGGSAATVKNVTAEAATAVAAAVGASSPSPLACPPYPNMSSLIATLPSVSDLYASTAATANATRGESEGSGRFPSPVVSALSAYYSSLRPAALPSLAAALPLQARPSLSSLGLPALDPLNETASLDARIRFTNELPELWHTAPPLETRVAVAAVARAGTLADLRGELLPWLQYHIQMGAYERFQGKTFFFPFLRCHVPLAIPPPEVYSEHYPTAPLSSPFLIF
jgi:hypothetical protein